MHERLTLPPAPRSNWLRGDVCQYDVSDPAAPRLAGRAWLGGAARRGGPVKVTAGLPEELGGEQPEAPTVRGVELRGGPQMLQLSLDGARRDAGCIFTFFFSLASIVNLFGFESYPTPPQAAASTSPPPSLRRGTAGSTPVRRKQRINPFLDQPTYSLEQPKLNSPTTTHLKSQTWSSAARGWCASTSTPSAGG